MKAFYHIFFIIIWVFAFPQITFADSARIARPSMPSDKGDKCSKYSNDFKKLYVALQQSLNYEKKDTIIKKDRITLQKHQQKENDHYEGKLFEKMLYDQYQNSIRKIAALLVTDKNKKEETPFSENDIIQFFKSIDENFDPKKNSEITSLMDKLQAKSKEIFQDQQDKNKVINNNDKYLLAKLLIHAKDSICRTEANLKKAKKDSSINNLSSYPLNRLISVLQSSRLKANDQIDKIIDSNLIQGEKSKTSAIQLDDHGELKAITADEEKTILSAVLDNIHSFEKWMKAHSDCKKYFLNASQKLIQSGVQSCNYKRFLNSLYENNISDFEKILHFINANQKLNLMAETYLNPQDLEIQIQNTILKVEKNLPKCHTIGNSIFISSQINLTSPLPKCSIDNKEKKCSDLMSIQPDQLNRGQLIINKSPRPFLLDTPNCKMEVPVANNGQAKDNQIKANNQNEKESDLPQIEVLSNNNSNDDQQPKCEITKQDTKIDNIHLQPNEDFFKKYQFKCYQNGNEVDCQENISIDKDTNNRTLIIHHQSPEIKIIAPDSFCNTPSLDLKAGITQQTLIPLHLSPFKGPLALTAPPLLPEITKTVPKEIPNTVMENTQKIPLLEVSDQRQKLEDNKSNQFPHCETVKEGIKIDNLFNSERNSIFQDNHFTCFQNTEAIDCKEALTISEKQNLKLPSSIIVIPRNNTISFIIPNSNCGMKNSPIPQTSNNQNSPLLKNSSQLLPSCEKTNDGIKIKNILRSEGTKIFEMYHFICSENNVDIDCQKVLSIINDQNKNTSNSLTVTLKNDNVKFLIPNSHCNLESSKLLNENQLPHSEIRSNDKSTNDIPQAEEIPHCELKNKNITAHNLKFKDKKIDFHANLFKCQLNDQDKDCNDLLEVTESDESNQSIIKLRNPQAHFKIPKSNCSHEILKKKDALKSEDGNKKSESDICKEKNKAEQDDLKSDVTTPKLKWKVVDGQCIDVNKKNKKDKEDDESELDIDLPHDHSQSNQFGDGQTVNSPRRFTPTAIPDRMPRMLPGMP